MDMILKIFGSFWSWVIVFIGFIVSAFLLSNFFSLRSEKNTIKKWLDIRNNKYDPNPETGELDETEDTDAKITPDTIRAAEKAFNSVCSKHTALAQLIPIFPLMGVFGTVWGLMEQASADNIENMLKSLDTALGTTFLGILFAIIMKAFDALCSSRIISDTEVLLDDFDKKVELSKNNEFQR